jgi:CHASE2 domain-containing sensor protein
MNTFTPRQRIGLVLAGVLSAASVPAALSPTPEGEVGPPLAILALGTLLGVVGLLGVVAAWVRSSATAVRVVAACLIVNLLTALPAFFVEVPAWLKLAVAVSVLVAIAAVVLMFSDGRRSGRRAELSAS